MKCGERIILVGLMGAGKTTVGRLLARRLRREFLDSDHEVEARCGVSIAVIFDIEGEAGFRAREAQVLEELCARPGIVLASGGGAVLAPENRRRLAAAGCVIYLHAAPEELWQRLQRDRSRPLLATADPCAKLKALYAERDPLYREVADLIVEAGGGSAPALARELALRLEQECRLSV